MIKIVVLGTGNVASHFIRVFSHCPQSEVVQIYNHSAYSLEAFSNYDTTTNINHLKPADLYLICIKDDHVEDLAQKIHFTDAIVAHTSGSLPLLQHTKQQAVFYPLQTFSKDKPISFEGLPICIETHVEKNFKTLEHLAENFGAKAFKVNTQQRQDLHLAAVFVCNFVNYLYHIGHDICAQKDLPFEILRPLIKETADKINFKNPKEAQTGPAKRKDQTTINRHIHQLQNPNYQEIYRYLTTSIQKTYE